MKFFLYNICFIVLFLSSNLLGQMAFKVSSGSSSSAFLFGTTTGKKTQLLYLPTDFNTSVSGPIARLYFMYGDTYDSETNYTNLKINLGMTDAAAFNGSAFFTGLTNVLTKESYNIPPGSEGDWFSITLDSLFDFNAEKTLIVEIIWDSNTNNNFLTRYGTTTSGRKIYSNSISSTSGFQTSSWQNFGYDISGDSYNMQIISILSPIGLINSSSAAVSAQFKNAGNNPAEGVYYAKIFDQENNLIYTDSIQFSNVLSGVTEIVNFKPINSFPFSGTYKILSYVVSINDEIPDDDSSEAFFSKFFPSQPIVVSYNNSTESSSEDGEKIMAALDYLNLEYDVYSRTDTIVTDFSPWETLIWAEDNEIDFFERSSITSFLDSGKATAQKSLMIMGNDILYHHDFFPSSRDTVFTRNYLHAIYYSNDANGLNNKGLICGEVINNGICDSLLGSSPDGMGTYNGSFPAYKFDDASIADSVSAGVAYNGSNFSVLFYGFSAHELTNDVNTEVSRVLTGSITWITDVCKTIPVELVAFTGKAEKNNAVLLWETATELNNRGFAVERKENDNFFEIGFIQGKGTSSEKVFYSFLDNNLSPGNYIYRLKQIDYDGTIDYSEEISIEIKNIAQTFALNQNYPNPFNPVTKIKYSVPEDAFVSLTIFNALGEKVIDLVNREVKAGNHEVNFNAENLSSGIYFYRIESGKNTAVKKMIFMK